MTTPIEQITDRQVGVVDTISPSEVEVNLDRETPQSVSMGTGQPQLCPRLNSFLLIPCESSFIVGKVGWLSIKPSPFPRRKGIQDFGILDLPFPLRKLKLNILGILKAQNNRQETGKSYQINYKFKRGIHLFPSLGDTVILPDSEQLKAIIESGTDGNIKIGTCPLANNAAVKINANRIFGRHLAVLGNTGSGKSCTIAGLIKWSLEEAKKETPKEKSDTKNPNARFIILDPNGEYTKTFKDANIFEVRYSDNKENQLKVPYWLWNLHEWASITQASDKTQKPLLSEAIKELKNPIKSENQKKITFRDRLGKDITYLRSGINQRLNMRKSATNFGHCLMATADNLRNAGENFSDWKKTLNDIAEKIETAIKPYKSGDFYNPFPEQDIDLSINEMKSFFDDHLGQLAIDFKFNEDTPVWFDDKDLVNHVEILGGQENISQHIDTLIMRIRTIFSDDRMREIICNTPEQKPDLMDWLNQYIGKDDNQHVNIINLSLVPQEIIYLVTAVIARIVFEALQRYKREHKESKTLPTVLVMEEAHTFIRKYEKDYDDFSSSGICRHVFEKIAKEGRKFGLGLVLSSQRPAELSPTVLSQCNTFLLHRITNDRDQEFISRLVPDSLKGMMQELPALPLRHAYLLGWASEIPILVEISELDEVSKPKSDDPDFWGVWTRKEARKVNWEKIAEKWQGNFTQYKPENDVATDTNSEDGT